jgi:prepilin-type N-terminal cleavage/methylation domain-containing protein
MSQSRATTGRAFSLVELLVVILIIGIISAIAIPRMSRGAAGAQDSALLSNLAMLRSAIDLYQYDHNGTPPAVATIVSQLTLYSDENGNTSASRTAVYCYGPYIRAIPSLPVGSKKGLTKIASATAADVAWVYNVANATIQAGASESDDTGKAYSSY